jgi:hypothetical protein
MLGEAAKERRGLQGVQVELRQAMIKLIRAEVEVSVNNYSLREEQK